MLALIGTARYETLLRRLLSTKGSEAAPLLSPELQPVLVVEGDRPEQDYLKGTRRFMGEAFQAAQVADLSQTFLVNPAGSGVVAVIERVEGLNASPGGVGMGTMSNLALGITGGTVLASIESRNPGQNATCELRTLVAVGFNILELAVIGNTTGTEFFTLENPGIILGPGSGWGSISRAVNQPHQSNWRWTERALEASEE